MYPRLTLKIKDHRPVLIFTPEEGMNRQMTLAEENLAELAIALAEELELIDEDRDDIDNLYREILQLATEGNERFYEEIPNLKKDSSQFYLEDHLDTILGQVLETADSFGEYEDSTSEDVINELKKNQSIDILASLLELMYNIMISKTLLVASELGIGRIHIQDYNGNLRLKEKMAGELSKIDIELFIDPIN